MDTLAPLVVKNLSPEPVTIGWNNHFVTIPPDEVRTATFDAVVNFFGDPRAIDDIHSNVDDAGVRSWVPDRKSEIRRLQCKWGNTFAQDESKIFCPEVEVTTLEGERVWTVANDPEGRHVNPKLIAIGETQDLNNQIQTMQRQLDTLLKLKETGGVDMQPAGEIPTDDSPQPRRGGRVMGKDATES